MVNAADGRNATLITAVVVAIGLAVCGYLVGNGAKDFRGKQRTVTVKGLADKDVVSDFVIWTIRLNKTGAEASEVQNALKQDREKILAFLTKYNVADADIERTPTSTYDRFASEYNNVKLPVTRYTANATIIVRSAKVDVVRIALASTDDLLQSGVLLSGGRDDGRPNVVYRYTKFNDLRPELISNATKNARASAEKFAADSSKVVGSIRSAQQGLIQIFGEEGSDESNSYSSSSFRKKIRVVNTIEFDIE